MPQRLDILLVDDNPMDLMFFRRAVQKTGLNICVQTLTGGQQAMDYLNAQGPYSDRSKYPWPDLIVFDLNMPEINGFDFLVWRKASTLFASIPVIVCSGSNESADVKSIFELGANKLLLKPAALEDWENIIHEVWDFGTAARSAK